MSRTDRQRELVETYRTIRAENLPHVLVGGWAVSTFQTRFTTDVDVVVPSEALTDYDSLLTELGYEQTFDEDVARQYEGRMVGYEARVGDHAVSVETMVDALRCRQTGAEWSYRYMAEHSRTRPLDVAPDVEARVPEPALLFAIKLHSGRRADARDLVVIASEADLERVDRHLRRGDPDRLADRIATVHERITSDGFEDAFKGVFQQSSVPEPDVEQVAEYLRRTIEER